jgi:cytochrome c-type biogenesis protein CcmH/NrfG
MLGDIYTAWGRAEEARKSYEKALHLAMTVEPEFQRGWAEALEQKLKQAGGSLR